MNDPESTQPPTDSDRINKILSLRAEAVQLQQEARAAGDMTTALMLGSELALIDFTLDTEYGITK